jgi:type IV secretion system protein VirD4
MRRPRTNPGLATLGGTWWEARAVRWTNGSARVWAGWALGLALGLQAAGALVGGSFAYAPALGPGLRLGAEARLYPPWAILVWRARHGEAAPRLFAAAGLLVLLGAAFGGLAARALGPGRPARTRGFGGLAEARRAGLLAGRGCIYGELAGRILASPDLRPSLVTGGTRSGKGRGHVIPTLLAWTDSALVHDPKGELWRVTAGWRSSFSHVLRFAPRDLASMRWNPLAEIRPGPGEIAQVQRLVAILADPGGGREEEAIWDRAAGEMLQALILHVLYTAPDADKTLIGVRARLADLDAEAEAMARTLHLPGEDGPRPHPFVRTAARGYLSMHDRFRTSVQGTARSYLGWLAGEDVERALSASDLRLGDLACADAPISLYVEVAPADAQALRPLVRLVFYAAGQALTAFEDADDAGRPKRRPVLLLLDEFPLLGRIAFLEKGLRLMSGYGLKTLLVAQSLNDIAETYGPHNTILDNCFVYTAFAALDPLTQEKVSRLTGSALELRESRSGPAGLAAGRASVTRGEVERPLLEPGEIRGLADADQLMFVAGRRPFRAKKLKYDRRRPFRARAGLPLPDPSAGPDTPGAPPHPWSGREALGVDETLDLPRAKEAEAAILDRRVQARADAAAEAAYIETRRRHAEEEAAMDHLQGRRP